MSQISETLAFVTHLPKTDLHVHFEGLVTRQQFGARTGGAVEAPSGEGVFKAQFANVADLIRSIRLSNVILDSRVACATILGAYLEQSASFGVRHVELAVEPEFHLERGLNLSDLFGGINDALERAELELGITSLLVLSVARDRPVADAFAILDLVERAGIAIRAVGIAGYDHAQPLAAFSGFMQEAAARGHAIIAHAGEGTNAAEVWEAINEFPVHRIDHGIAAIEDRRLIRHLKESGIPLATAPVSNHLTGANKYGAAIATLLRQGVKVSVNTDDPGTLQSSLQGDYSMLIAHQNLTPREVLKLAANGFASSLLEPATKAGHLTEIGDIERRLGSG